MDEPIDHDQLQQEIETLRLENARLRTALADSAIQLNEPEEIIRAIRRGEIDALVVEEEGQEEIYSLQRFDSVYRRMVEDSLPHGVWMAETDGRLLYASRSFLDLVKLELSELRTKGQFHFLPPQERLRVEREWRRCRELGEACSVEYSVTLDDGSQRAIWTHGILAKMQDGLPCWVGFNLDVTERKEIKDELRKQSEALRQSEDRFRLIADTMPQFVWVTRPDGYHEYFNQRWYDYVGCDPEQCRGHNWSLAMHSDDRQRAVERWAHSVRTGEPYEIEYRIGDKHGEYRWFLGRALPVRDESGNIVKWYGTCTDITSWKQMEQALKDADRRKDDFLATLAHELRNPLAPIRTGLEVLKLAGHDQALAEKTRSMMEKQLEQMIRLIDDLLEVSRITQGKLRLRKRPIELSSAIQSALDATRFLMEESDHHVSVALPPEPVYVDADLTRLAQIFSNLLSNAAKYTERGGQITLTAQREGDRVTVRVGDSGIGIPADHLPKLFQMFSQVDSALERSQGGLGIGLALVRGLVEMHGGTVHAHSAGLGKGSEFTVQLPTLQGADQPPQQSKSSNTAAGSQSATKILIADDNVDATHVLATLLQVMGHDVREAHDGLEAVQMAASFRPRLILLDIGMPKMNGYEVARHIRAEPWGQDIVIAAVTGWGQDEDKRLAADAGFDHHLTKPIEVAAVQKMLQDNATDSAMKL